MLYYQVISSTYASAIRAGQPMELGGCQEWRALYKVLDNFPNQVKVVHILYTVGRTQVLHNRFYEGDLTKVQYFVNDFHTRTLLEGTVLSAQA